jgi:hypothetical protein
LLTGAQKEKQFFNNFPDEHIMQNGQEWHQEDDAFDFDMAEDLEGHLHGCIDQLPENKGSASGCFILKKIIC